VKRSIPLVLACLAFSACVAVTVERHRPRRGPVKEVGYVDYGGGQVRYSAEGWSLIVASRRKMALKLMSSNCGPDLTPAITDEYSRMDADAAYNGEDIDASMKIGDEHYQIERYVHIAYECRPKGSPPPSISTSTARGASLIVPEAAASTATAAVSLSSAPAAAPAASSATLAAPELPR
jgi:hypothetical protein